MSLLQRMKMNRSLPSVFAFLAVLTVGFVLFATKLTSGAFRTAGDPVGAPSFDTLGAASAPEDTAVFAGGCFWGVEAVYDHVKGAKHAVSESAGGNIVRPSYEQVS